MTVTTAAAGGGAPVQQRDDLVSVTIDGIVVTVPKGTLVIRAAERLGIAIPRFCDHPLLDPAGACRQCLVEVEGQIKPLASCTTTVTEGMVVRTQLTSEVAADAQHGVMELLLINHPLDCPVCDKGGECPLQNQAMSNGRGESRFDGPKRTFPKPIALSAQVLLDRERCISCARCTRFADQIAGDPFIELVDRGSHQQIAVASDAQPFNSYFSGNTVQICPVGALTGTAYRFRSRPFDLVSTPTACEHCASGCALRTDTRRGTVLRRLAGDDPAVNEEWNCDKGRWAFTYADVGDRITTPLVRDDEGALVEASWPEALDIAARGLAAARAGRGAGVLVGGRSTLEDAYAYGKFARAVLGTNDVDFRSRPHSEEEAQFLGAFVAGRGPDDASTPTYADLDHAPVVLLVGLEPEEESPIVFLRLRKAVRSGHSRVASIAPFATRGLDKLQGALLSALPGSEGGVLDGLAAGTGLDGVTAETAERLREAGAVILVGERLVESPGGLSAAGRLATATGARLGWVPRRAGERGAVEAGALPHLLPGGRPVADAEARVDTAAVWGVAALPTEPGRDTAGILAAAADGDLDALVVGGVDPGDLADPAAATAALAAVGFLVSLEVRHSAVTELAEVVLPVAPVAEKAGSFLDWEGRARSFPQVLRHTFSLTDAGALSLLADELGADLGLVDTEAARSELGELEPWTGARTDPPASAVASPAPRAGHVLLATWHTLLDAGRMQAGEPHLAGTARPSVALMSGATAGAAGISDGAPVTVHSEHGWVRVPAEIGDVPDGVVWLPTNGLGCAVRRDLRVGTGAALILEAGACVMRLADTVTPPTGFGDDPWWLIALKAVAVFVILVLFTLLNIWGERRVVGRMQQRIGPNRVGPFGLLQGLVDGIKLALKEDIIPKAADKAVFILAPILAVVPAFLTWAVIPFGPEVSIFGYTTRLQLTDFPVAVLYIIAVASVGIYGIVLAGWSSGSTYPLLGGLRSSAQMISYEVAMGLSFVGVFLMAGSMSTSQIVEAQANGGTAEVLGRTVSLPGWYIVLLLPSFVIYVISMVGETNRAPFDLPEAEGELVGGFHTEYSSLKFALFFLAEYINLVTVSALATTLFLGGWRAPWPISLWSGANEGWVPLIWFFSKLLVFIFVFIWLRGTLPRLRYDQFMKLGWKVLIPASLVWILAVAAVRVARSDGAELGRVIVGVFVAGALLLVVWSLVDARNAKRVLPEEPPSEPDPFDGGYPVPPLPTEETTRA